MATVYGIISQFGGAIDVESEVDRGTSLRIYLPRLDEAVEQPSPLQSEAELPGGRETVLLVEDEGMVRQLALKILTRLGYRVLTLAENTADRSTC